MENQKCTAIVLSAGKGRRMETKVQKQYLEVNHKPILYYSLKAFQDSPLVQDIIVVVGAGQQEYVKEQIVEKYCIDKVRKIVLGGAERYLSVWEGLQCVEDGYVFIHDGARPFIDEKMLERAYEAVRENDACVLAMPTKDTVKIADQKGFVSKTPERKKVWLIQTPQVFLCSLIKHAYSDLIEEKVDNVTDDAMVLELMTGHPIKLVEGDYRNIKITTPDDLLLARIYCEAIEK